MQTIEQYLIPNGYAGANVTADGAASSELPYLVVGMPCQFSAHVVDAEGNPATPAGLANVASWKFVLAGDFDPETAPCYTTDEIVWDAEECAWTVLLDETRTASMLALLGDEPWVNIGCEVVGLGEDEDWAHPAYVLQWTARIRGRRDSDGTGVHPATGERVANVLYATEGLELRVGEGGALKIVHDGTETTVTLQALAAAAAGGVTPEERAAWADRSKIVNGDNIVDVTADGKARHYVKDESLGLAKVVFEAGFGAAYGTTSYSAEFGATVRFSATAVLIPDYGKVWIDADTDILPSAYDPTAEAEDYPGYPAAIGWHLWAESGDTPQELRYFSHGPSYTLAGMDTATPTATLLLGTETGTKSFSREIDDAGVRHELAHKDHTHESVVSASGAHALRMPNAGTPAVDSTAAVAKTVGSRSVLVWKQNDLPVTGMAISFLTDYTWAEMLAGVPTIEVSVQSVLIDGRYPTNGTPFPVVVRATATLYAVGDGVTQYNLTSGNARLDGGVLVMDTGGAHSLTYFDTATTPKVQYVASFRDDTMTQTRSANVSTTVTKPLAWGADVADIQAVIPSDASPSNKLVTAANVPQIRYTLVSPALAASGTTVSATLQDRAVNAITLASTVTAATFTFPAPVAGYARDFFVRLVIEGSTVPTISFLESGGGTLEDAFDADDDAWAEIEPGVNVLMFTETSQEAAS